MSEASENAFRFERKYHITEVPTAEIESWVWRCPALFGEAYPPRFVNNIYFDSHDLANYFQNIDGLANRTKLRIRWYGALFGPIKRPVLEFKLKRGMVGSKESFPLKSFQLEKGFQAGDLQPVLSDPALPDEVLIELSHVEPSLINRYHRKYFVSADGHYRITIDDHLEFHRIHRHDNHFLGRSTMPESTVMELKYSGDIADMNDRIMNFFPYRVTRMSKYVTGLEAVEG